MLLVDVTRFHPAGGSGVELVFGFEAAFGITQPAVMGAQRAANVPL